jgi:YhcH/YjgK/YiaL family protein
MIADKLKNAVLYSGISERLARALELLKDRDIINKEDGRYELDGDNLFCLVQKYETSPADKCNCEAHKKYIDVQFIASGEELIQYANINDLEVKESYDDTKDKILYKPSAKMSSAILTSGMFAVYFPEDAHLPCAQVSGPSNVHKVVVKVKV